MSTGYIYMIQNTINKKVYIGQTNNINQRIKSHKYNLQKGIHANVDLQIDYNKFGPENFTYKVIQQCDSNLLNVFEGYYIYKYQSFIDKNGYNKLIPLPTVKEKTINKKFPNILKTILILNNLSCSELSRRIEITANKLRIYSKELKPIPSRDLDILCNYFKCKKEDFLKEKVKFDDMDKYLIN